ncbi:MAG: hypothetical protein HFE97_00050 [Oscillospiraceae bacterium]|nr:hypothetical protein [Oscillospiraceae bacterium]
MDRTITRRLERLEAINPIGGVALLILQADGTWELSLSGKRYTYKTETEAKRHVQSNQPLVIIDL